MSINKQDRRCKARAKTGRRCGAAATAGGLCFFHANPNKASELGRIGGRSKRHAPESADLLPTLDNAIAVRDAAARLFADVRAGKLHPRTAASLVPLMNLQLHAISAADIEQRLAKVEKQLAEANGDLDDDTKVPLLESGNLPKVIQAPPMPEADEATKPNGFSDGSILNES